MAAPTRANDSLSRRGFLAGLTAASAAAVLSRHALADPQDAIAKPNSVFNGVHVGCITYSYRGKINSAEDTLKAFIEDGLSETELMDGPIRLYAGISAGGGRRGGANGAPATPPPAMSDEQRESHLAKCRELRKMYNDAGVNIHCEKLPFGKTDEEIEFDFEVAKALGVKAITTERSGRSWLAGSPLRREAQDLGGVPQPHQQRAGDRQP